jgi:hypothetical protein
MPDVSRSGSKRPDSEVAEVPSGFFLLEIFI